MTFTCRQCGTCCLFLGDYIVIEQEIGPFEFQCLSVSTGTVFTARIDDDKRDIFLNISWIAEHPAACPFLRPQDDRIVCTVHETSPYQCKAYRCIILRIFSPDGQEVGRVNGTYGLITDDSELRLVWEEGKRVIDWWAGDMEDCICRFLERRGYTVQ